MKLPEEEIYTEEYLTNQEVKTNKTLDGKPIYKCILNGKFSENGFGNSSSFFVDSIDFKHNVKQILKMEGIAMLVVSEDSYETPLNINYDASLKSIIQYGYITEKIYIGRSGSFYNTRYFITVEYTKTTD